MNNFELRFLRWLACMAFLPLLPFVSSAQGVSVTEHQQTEKAKVEVGFTHIGKPTKVIETPWGSKDIYDPLQDICVMDAFKSLFYWSNEDSYFQSRPPSLYKRSRRDNQRSKEISELQDGRYRYISLAKHESLLQLQEAGCSFVETLNCSTLSVTLNEINTCPINGRVEYPFLLEMVGDPMRGTLEEQLELFFESSCSVWNEKDL